MESLGEFPLCEEVVDLAGRTFRILRVADIDLLFARLLEKPANHPDVTDERIPYWAEVWPSALGLSLFLLENPDLVRGKRVLEVGCGLGLPGIVAGSLGATVILSDYLAEPLALAGVNWRNNLGTQAEVLQLDWRDPAAWPAADIVLASDIAYESRAFVPLEHAFRLFTAGGGSVILSDPDRHFARDFFNRLGPYTLSTHGKEIVDRAGMRHRVMIRQLSVPAKD